MVNKDGDGSIARAGHRNTEKVHNCPVFFQTVLLDCASYTPVVDSLYQRYVSAYTADCFAFYRAKGWYNSGN